MSLAAASAALFAQQERPERPNFVLFIADDVSAADWGCYGHPTLQTPSVDALARTGLRFTHAYLCTSSCSPTRTSLITGRYPHNTGAPELHMGDDPTLAKLPQFPAELRKAGYYTVQSGKTHFNGDVSKSFDRIYGRRDAGPGGEGRWVACLAERPRDRPFFMWFAADDAHRKWDMPLSEGPHGPEDAVVPPYLVDGPKTRRDLAHYYNEVHRFDAAIGKVVAELEHQRVRDNTLIIVMADNGRPFPRDKTWLYDSGIKTPLVVSWPATIQEAAAPSSLISVIDLPPTLLELAGVDVPASFQGVSAVPLLRNPEAVTRDFAFCEHNWHTQRAHERAVRWRNYVYYRNNLPGLMGFNILHWSQSHAHAFHELYDHWKAGKLNDAQAEIFARPRPQAMLFDVSEDPLQLTDLAKNPEHVKVLNYLGAVMEQWVEETGDTLVPFEKMTPGRMDRDSWKTIHESGRPRGGVVPGQSMKAHEIDRPGPMREAEVKAERPGGDPR